MSKTYIELPAQPPKEKKVKKQKQKRPKGAVVKEDTKAKDTRTGGIEAKGAQIREKLAKEIRSERTKLRERKAEKAKAKEEKAKNERLVEEKTEDRRTEEGWGKERKTEKQPKGVKVKEVRKLGEKKGRLVEEKQPAEKKTKRKKTVELKVVPVVGVVAGAVALSAVVTMVRGFGGSRTLTCHGDMKDLNWEKGEKYSYQVDYKFTFKYDSLVAVEAERRYQTSSEKALTAIKYLSDITVKASQYTDNVYSDITEEGFVTRYFLLPEALTLSPEEFNSRYIGTMLELSGYYEYDEKYNTVYKYDKLSDYLTYDILREEYSKKEAFTCD